MYVGITSNIIRRVYEHRAHIMDGHTKKYQISRLVYFEIFDSVEAAILREKQLKKWKRLWKIGLIEKQNPYWSDLYDQFI